MSRCKPAIVALSLFVVTACGGTEGATGSPEVVDDAGSSTSERSVGGSGTSDRDDAASEQEATEREVRDVVATVEQLRDEPVREDRGDLRAEYHGVSTSIGEYDRPPDRLAELVDLADAIAVGRAGDRSQFYDGEPGDGIVYTSQAFSTVEVLKGAIGGSFAVSIVGGAHRERDGNLYLIESDMNPQYRTETEYLLFLREQPDEAHGDHWWTVGPAVGRYTVEDGVVTRTFAADLLGMTRDHDVSAAGAEGHDELSMIGSTVEDIADEVVARSP